MTSRSFTLLIGVVVALGISIGGAFVGGIALGKSQDAEAPQTAPEVPAPSGGFQQPDGADAASLDLLRQRIQSGDATPEELAQLRQQFQGQGQFGGGGFGGGRPGGGGFGQGLTGTIDAVDGNVITVDTPQGPLQATVTDETTIQTFSVGTLEDLLQGVRVTVIGQSEGGTVEARSILLLPECRASSPAAARNIRSNMPQRRRSLFPSVHPEAALFP